MNRDVLYRLNAERTARRACVVVTDTGTGESRLVREGEADADPLGGAMRAALLSGRSGFVADRPALFLNVHLPPPRFLIVGAVHISQALAPMAMAAGFRVTVLDPRQAFATPERFRDVRLLAEWPDVALAREPLDAFTAVAAVTHDPKIDDTPLIEALKAGCFYVGALGSRKTHAKRLDRLGEAGLPAELTARIEAPIGLDIAAATPAEIAVAILASAIRALRRRAAEPTTFA